MPDWEIDEAGPENLVAQDGVDRDKDGLASIPFRQPLSGKSDLQFRAHKTLDKAAGFFSAALPQPQVLSPGPAILAVAPADNVELVPDAKSIQGLIRQQMPCLLNFPGGSKTLFIIAARGQAPFLPPECECIPPCERGCGKLRPPRRKLGKGDATACLFHRLRGGGSSPVGRSADAGRPQPHGNPARRKAFNRQDRYGKSRAPVPGGTVRMRVNLPEPCIGRCETIVQFAASLPALELSTRTSWSVPLVVLARCRIHR